MFYFTFIGRRLWQLLWGSGLFACAVASFLTLTCAQAQSANAPTGKLERLLHLNGKSKQLLTKLLAQYHLENAWVESQNGQRVWGYADQHSILPGQPIKIFLSVKTGSKSLMGTLRVLRISGKYNSLVKEIVSRRQSVSVNSQIITPDASAIGPEWTNGLAFAKTADWKSGLYVVDFEHTDGRLDRNVAWFVVKPQVKTGDILVKIATNTVEAYNAWGGNSLYQSSSFGSLTSMVSFDRPSKLLSTQDAFYFIPWVETYAAARGLKVDYISDFDLSTDPSVLDGYKLFVSPGHDEYWTKEMFDAVENRIFSKGHNVLFLGANVAYWQVRYVDINQPPGGSFLGRQMICYKSYNRNIDPIASRVENEKQAKLMSTGLFRFGARRPETMLLGVGYQDWFDGKKRGYSYSVVDTSLPFFKDTGLKIGDKFRGVVGYEWDNSDPVGDGKRLWDSKLSMNANIPQGNIHVLFNAKPVSAALKKGKAEAVYWESPAGAKVFSAGTIWWSWGLSKKGVATSQFSKFNENLFNYMLQ